MGEEFPAVPAIFVGREAELARIARAAGEVRLFLIYGVAGVGKTSLAARAAQTLAGRLGARLVYLRCRAGESAVTAAAALGASKVGGLLDTARKQPLVACIDDVHRADPTLREALVYLAGRRAPLWLFATSREALPISPVAVDHLIVRLAGLDANEAQALWSRLSDLYGPPQAVLGPGQHTPLDLKQAFAANAPADRLGLSALQKRDANVLARACAFRRPVPAAALDADDETLARLEARFLIERPHGLVTVHDLVRDAVTPGAAEHAAALAYWQAEPASDSVMLEILHHAVAAGDSARAISILAGEAARVARVPPGAAVAERDIADAIDRLAETGVALPAPVRSLRAAIRARQGEPARALAELRELSAEDPMAMLEYGGVAVALGHSPEAREALGRALGDDRLPPPMRLFALGTLAGAHRHDGDIAGARRLFSRYRSLIEQTGGLGQIVTNWLDAALSYEARRYDSAAAAMARVRAALSDVAVPLSLPLIASLEAAIASARGDAPQGGDGEADDLFDEMPFLRYTARLLRAETLFRRGEIEAARTLGEEVARAAAQFGYVALAQGAAQLLQGRPGRFPCGKRREGFDDAVTRLETAERELALGKLEAAAQLAQSVERRAAAASWRHLCARARLARAECALRRGHVDEAAALAAAARELAYPDIIAACEVLCAAMDRLGGIPVPRQEGVLAARIGLDRPPSLLLRDSAGARVLLAPSQLADWDLSRYQATFDLAARRMRLRRRTANLAHRGAVFELARVLLRAPGATVPTAELVRAVWNLEYHPLRHHSRVTMAISRLRRLIGRKTIEGGPEGYRWCAPEPWAIIEPASAAPAQRGYDRA